MTGSRRRTRQRSVGFSLPELLVVISIIGLGVAASVPLISGAVRSAKIQGAANQLTISLRAARMIAVSKRQPVNVHVVGRESDPGNFYEYTDHRGRITRITMPEGAWITDSADIEFQPNGSISGDQIQTVVLEAGSDDNVEQRWSIETNLIGATTVTHESP